MQSHHAACIHACRRLHLLLLLIEFKYFDGSHQKPNAVTYQCALLNLFVQLLNLHHLSSGVPVLHLMAILEIVTLRRKLTECSFSLTLAILLQVCQTETCIRLAFTLCHESF